MHADVHEHGDDQPAIDSRGPKWRSMVIKQSIEGASVDVRRAASLPDATGGIVADDDADNIKDELPERREDNDRKGEVI